MYGYQMAFLCSAALMVVALLVSIFVIRAPKVIILSSSGSEQATGAIGLQEYTDLQEEANPVS